MECSEHNLGEYSASSWTQADLAYIVSRVERVQNYLLEGLLHSAGNAYVSLHEKLTYGVELSMKSATVVCFLFIVYSCHSLRFPVLKHSSNARYSAFKFSSSALHAITKSKQPGSNLPDLSQSRFPLIPEDGYDLIVVGSGPAGEAAAVRAAQLGARVAVVEKK